MQVSLEADHIGMLLLAAAGVDPIIAVLVRQNRAKFRRESTLTQFISYISTHPSDKKKMAVSLAAQGYGRRVGIIQTGN
jgi:predicted Zn-dependent protease